MIISRFIQPLRPMTISKLLICFFVILLPFSTRNVQAQMPASTIAHPISCPYNFQMDQYLFYLPVIQHRIGCLVGQATYDPPGDVSAAYIDVTSLTSSLDGEKLEATLYILDIPETLTFNRVGMQEGEVEYAWSVYIDVDNNPQTGDDHYLNRGAEYELWAHDMVPHSNTPSVLPFPYGLAVWVSKYNPQKGVWQLETDGEILDDHQANTIRLWGVIPGININSKLMFETYDANPSGIKMLRDRSACSGSN